MKNERKLWKILLRSFSSVGYYYYFLLVFCAPAQHIFYSQVSFHNPYSHIHHSTLSSPKAYIHEFSFLLHHFPIGDVNNEKN